MQPTIPANLPPPYNSIANSRVIVILTDSGYWIDDRTGLHQGAIAHILGSGYFDMLLLDERSATPNSAWLDIAWDQPVTGLIHAWDGAPNGFVKLELVAFPNTVGSAVIRARTSSSKAYNTNVIPGTTATLTLIKD